MAAHNSRTVHLHVSVFRARKLPASDLEGYSDPYCVLRVGKEKKKTSVQTKTVNPRWGDKGKGETFRFHVRLGVDFFLFVDLYDKDKTATDDQLGCVHIPLLSLSGEKEKSRWYSVCKSHATVDVSGELELGLRMTGGLSSQLKVHMEELRFLSREPQPFQAKIVVVDGSQYIFPGTLEKMEFVAQNVILSVSGHYRQGCLYLTNYRLLFLTTESRKANAGQLRALRKSVLEGKDGFLENSPVSPPSQESSLKFPTALRSDLSMAVPIGMIRSLQRSEGSTMNKATFVGLKAELKNFCSVQLVFAEESAESGQATRLADDLLLRLNGHLNAGPRSLQTPIQRIRDLCTPSAKLTAEKSPDIKFDLKTEMVRQGVKKMCRLRVLSSASSSPSTVVPPTAFVPSSPSSPPTLPDDDNRAEELGIAVAAALLPELSPFLPISLPFVTDQDPACAWRLTDANSTYHLCKTYPSHFVVPASVSDETLKVAAAFRSKRRVPTMTWYNKKYGNSISRSSQPNSGLGLGRRSEADEQLVDALRGGKDASTLLIFDARSFEAATGNKLKGKGTENLTYYRTSKLMFCDMGNIHDVRRSEDKLRELIQGMSDYSWWTNMGQTMWLQHIKRILEAGSSVALAVEQVRQSVLIHCSDGWDRTSQISSLAQLLLDSYYRTLTGFRHLVQKEWLLFGHKFQDRLGRPEVPAERSPVFNLWIDAVFQVICQFPEEFEFTDLFLLELVDAIDSGWYVDFLFNSAREKAAYEGKTPALSVWNFLTATKNESRYKNPLFKGCSGKVLVPVASEKMLTFWSRRYLPWDECCLARPLQPSPDAPQVDSESKVTPTKNGLGELMSPLTPEAEVKQHAHTPGFWVPDHWSESCQGCGGQFNFFRRRHHCRVCGRLFCYLCSDKRHPVKDGGVPERLCDMCFQTRSKLVPGDVSIDSLEKGSTGTS
eukprot:gb/GEZN01001201.1/.p1 GENE.gb/GEZN01001201.1/~~gb/GEZN01001201.1/.p1  ORF type:complete len:969 (-),score=92.55 gb/GEZN01001201.1/:324-3152(-)